MLVGVGGVEVVGNIVLQFTPPRTTPLGRAREVCRHKRCVILLLFVGANNITILCGEKWFPGRYAVVEMPHGGTVQRLTGLHGLIARNASVACEKIM